MKISQGQFAGSHFVWFAVIVSGLLLAGTPVASAANKSWNAGNGLWSNASKWTPAGVPPVHSDIYIGNMPGVQNSTVTIDNNIVVIYDYFLLTNGMTLDLNGSELVSVGPADITGAGTHLIARPSNAANQLDFWGDVLIGPGAHVELVDNVPIELGYNRANQGLISGRGSVRMGGNFSNDGVIKPGGNGGLLLFAGQGAVGWEIDLDGTSGNGHLQMDTAFSQLRLEYGSLADSFSGTLTMAPGALLTMDIDEGWTADAGADFNILGTNSPNSASQISGDPLVFNGQMNIGANQAHLRVLANTTLQTNPNVSLAASGWLEFDGTTSLNGGQYMLGQAAKVDFDGSTTIQGGTCNTPSVNPTDGAVNFNGPTTWNGTLTVNGIARQNGLTAQVTGNTIINAQNGIFDLDGSTENVVWNINNNFTVNAGHIDILAPVPNQFNGTMNVAGGFIPRVSMYFADPQTPWYMNGTMNLSGISNLFETRVGGSPIIVGGTLNLTGGKVSISADTTFSDLSGSATVNIAPAAAVLRTTARSYVRGATNFNGLGTLQNGTNGTMVIDNGSHLNSVGLVNQGNMYLTRPLVPNMASLISVDRFTNEAGANWKMRIGGYTLGQDFDHMDVTNGAAVLNGTLELELFNSNGVPFHPQIGDEFTILTAAGGVSGNLVVNPYSCLAGDLYGWSVLYGPNEVRVRVDSITGKPGDMNCDCNNDGLDIQRFVNAVMNPMFDDGSACDIFHADVNGDGNIDVNDTPPFIDLLMSAP